MSGVENKDIPEGGAKGTILPALDANFKQCFEKYVDVSHPLTTCPRDASAEFKNPSLSSIS
jgi:hypothetical protein